MGNKARPPAESQSYLVPIAGRPRDLDRILNDLRKSGMEIRHVFTDMPVWKVAGDLPVNQLGRLRSVQGIGEPQPEGTMTIEGPGEELDTPAPAARSVAPPSIPRRPTPPGPPPRSPRTGADLA
jgi:hypothetical protein